MDSANTLSGGNGNDRLIFGMVQRQLMGLVEGGAGNGTLVANFITLDSTNSLVGIKAIIQVNVFGTAGDNLIDLAGFQVVSVADAGFEAGTATVVGFDVDGGGGNDRLASFDLSLDGTGAADLLDSAALAPVLNAADVVLVGCRAAAGGGDSGIGVLWHRTRRPDTMTLGLIGAMEDSLVASSPR